jgi:hypothetical protein
VVLSLCFVMLPQCCVTQPLCCVVLREKTYHIRVVNGIFRITPLPHTIVGVKGSRKVLC